MIDAGALVRDRWIPRLRDYGDHPLKVNVKRHKEIPPLFFISSYFIKTCIKGGGSIDFPVNQWVVFMSLE